MDEGLIEKALNQLEFMIYSSNYSQKEEEVLKKIIDKIDTFDLLLLYRTQQITINSLKCKACYWYEDKIWECGTTPERCVECEKNDYCSFAERD